MLMLLVMLTNHLLAVLEPQMMMTSEKKPRPKRGDTSVTGSTYEYRTASLGNTQVLSKQVDDLTKKVEKLTKKVETLEKSLLKMKIENLAKTVEKLSKSLNAKKK